MNALNPSLSSNTLLNLKGVDCHYGQQPVVQDFDLSIQRGDICCLLGPSGCGKTTVLRSIAGFHPVTDGSIKLDGRSISSKKKMLAPEQRNIGMVFQDYALFPHLSVCDNITAIMVTHDQEEAFAFADKIGVLNKGNIEQWAPPFDLYHEPATRFVANFIGQGAFIPGHILDGSRVATEIGVIEGNRCYDWLPDTRVEVLLRPDDIIHDDSSVKRAEIMNKVFAGTSSLYTLKLPTGSQVAAAFPSHHDYQVGDLVGINIEADHLIAFRIDE